MNGPDKRMLEREALRNVIQQWNVNRLDLFELSEPNEDLSFHGVMRFYFQDSGQKVATKCIRVASDATVSDVIETLIEKFRPDMRMLSVPSYALYELHSSEERKLANDEKPLLVQLNWHVDDREGRFLLKNIDDKTVSAVSNADVNTNFKRKLSKREKKELKKKEKISRMKSDGPKDIFNPVAEKLYTELPETSFTRSISNPEAVMRRRRQQKLERKLQQFRSKDGGPDTGGTLKIYGESLCSDVPYKTFLLSINDCAAGVVREMLDKLGLGKNDPQYFCLVQVTTTDNTEYILDDDECPLAIVMTHSHPGSIMFHVRRRPADSQLRKRKKKSGSLRVSGSGGGSSCVGVLTETLPDGTPAENAVSVRLGTDVLEVGSANGAALQLYGPSIQPRHCVLATTEGLVTVTPRHADAEIYIDGERIYHTTFLQHGCLLKFGRISTFRFMDPVQENSLSRNLSQSQHFDSGSVYDRSPTSPIPDNLSKTMSPSMHSQLDGMQSSMDPSGINSTAGSDFQRALSPSLGNNKMGSQDNFGMSYNKNQIDNVDSISGYNNNNNNNTKMDGESLILSQHLANSKADLLQENHFASPYNGIGSPQNAGSNKDQQNSGGKNSGSQYKDNYETTFDLDGNVETKSICSAKSGGSGHDNRLSRGQEAILPAVLEFPEHCQQLFLQSVITGLDVNAPAFKLAPVYTLYLCARYRASTHYRPELSPTERAHKLTALLHHIATLIQNTVLEKYSDASVQAFWMANSSELLHFLKCDRHISAFSIQAQDILAHTVQTAFSNLVGCFHVELSQVLPQLLDEQQNSEAAASLVLGSLGTAMALLRKCRVNAALTIQLFSQLFHYINVWCFNKVVTSPHMWCGVWGALVSVRLAPIGTWAERQGLELPADCHLALIHQCAHLLQAPKNTPEDMANLTSACFKLNSVQLRCLLGGFTEDPSGSGGPGSDRLQPELVEAAVKHAQVVADELHRADGREITLEESSTLPLSLMIPEDGFSADVVRGLPSGLAEFLSPLQRAALCRLAPQPHSQGHWTVYMNGYHGGGMTVRPPQQPVVQVIQLQKNSNGMGLSIVAAKGAGQTRLGIYIKSVVAGGAAAADQRLMAGDQLLSVDGHSLVGITQERAAEYLVRTGPLVTLEVAKQGAVLHGLATLLRQPSPQADRGLRRMSERDLPSKLEQEQSSAGGHIPNSTVKSSKSVPALHEHTKQHEVFNPGYSRTSSNNSIPAMPGLKGKPPHHQADQNSFYQNLSVYRNTGLADRSSALRNSQNALQLQGQSQQMKANAIAEGQGQGPPNQSGSDRLSLSSANQRPQSAYYGNQPAHSPGQGTNGMRTAQSTKDLAYASETQGNHQVRGGYPSMPNVNQGYSTHNPNQQYGQMQGAYSTNQLQTNTYNRPPMSPMNPNQYNSQAVGNGQYGNQTQFANQGQGPNQYHSQNLGNNQYSNQQQVVGGTLNQYSGQMAGSSPNLRGQAKLAEMSEEVTRRQQRGPLSPHGDSNLMSPMQQNRFQYGSDAYNNNNGPMSPNTPMTPNKPQPPVAPKPQGMKRGVSGEMISQDIVEGPPLPPTATHPLYHHSNANDEDGNYLPGSAEPSPAGYYGTQRGGQAQQTSGQSLPPNPWEREEREKELEARRLAARVWRDKQISALQGIGEDRRTPQQEQQLRALTLERDFQRRAQQAQTEDDDKETERPPVVPPHGGLLRVATNNGNANNNNNGQAAQGINPAQDLNLVPVASNIVSSIQPICVATSNTNGSEQTQDPSQQQQNENRNPNQLPPPPPVQPKSILKSNLRLDNLNSNSPQSPSKTHKNASFSANLTPQSLKFDNNPKIDQKYDVNNSKYDHNVNNKYDTNVSSKYDSSQPKYPEQMNPISGKYEQHLSYNINNTLSNQNLSKYDPNLSNNAVLSPNTLSQNLSNMNINANLSYSRLDNADARQSYDNQIYNQQNSGFVAAPPPPERGSSFAVMSQAQALRSNVSTSSQMSLVNQNSNQPTNQALSMKDKRVSFHDNDQQNNMSIAANAIDSRELEMEPIREDPDRFITEAEMMLQSPTTPTGTNVTHTPGVIGAQEVYRDPRQRRLAEQQRAQEAGNTPIPEKLSFKEKMKMFALESGESNTPKDKVKISRAQRDIDAVH